MPLQWRWPICWCCLDRGPGSFDVEDATTLSWSSAAVSEWVPLQCLWRDSFTLISTLLLTCLTVCSVLQFQCHSLYVKLFIPVLVKGFIIAISVLVCLLSLLLILWHSSCFAMFLSMSLGALRNAWITAQLANQWLTLTMHWTRVVLQEATN